METHEIIQALRRTTQALKDIIGAADNGRAYTPAELAKLFIADYAEGSRVIIACGHTEIA